MVEYLIGVDGGGSGTRVCVQRADGTEIGRGQAGPSSLAHGIDNAWDTVLCAVDRAFVKAGLERPAPARIAIGLGLAGVHNKAWAASFAAKAPVFDHIALDTDAFCSLLGAHQGQPGAVVAIGTGSVGEALLADGTRIGVGGWGFPSGDEASGGWLGLQAVNHAQRVLDGRRSETAFARAVIGSCGGGRDALFSWMAQANQTAYAQLAPLVIAHAASDERAHALMVEAGEDIAALAAQLDPLAQLPLSFCGGLAAPMMAYLPASLCSRALPAQADAVDGAMQLLRRSLRGS